MNVTTFGLDIAKNVMQVHWVDGQTGEVGRRVLKRSQLAPFFARQAQCRIVLEACGSGHYWGRTLSALGHQVQLIHARHVRPFVRGNKSDAADAQAIWSAAQQPDMRWVPFKSEQQQAVLSLHRVRSQWIKVRTQTVNGLRGLLYEFGVLLPGGRQAGVKAIGASRAEIDAQVPALMRGLIDGQLQMLRQIDERIAALEGELQALEKQLDSARRVRQIPGVGVLGATALAAVLGEDARGYRNAREFAACLGLVPCHRGTGGKVVVGRLSKRGDPYLRTLLMHGARAVIFHSKTPSTWLQQMLARRPLNVVVAALANKMARMAWALVAHEREYQAGGFAKADSPKL
ncbi:IS110 family transposase [Achromobacter aegrifaciens]